MICVFYYIHSDFLSICGYSVIFKTNIKAKNKIYQQFNINQQATNAYQYFIFNYCFFFNYSLVDNDQIPSLVLNLKHNTFLWFNLHVSSHHSDIHTALCTHLQSKNGGGGMHAETTTR